MNIIGLAGKARSGKNSAAARLAHHDYLAVAFADAIRDCLCILNVADEYMHTDKEAPTHPHGCSYRELAQTLGDWGRARHPQFWIMQLEMWLEENAAADDLIVITDVRYPNEADWVRQRGVLWHIERPGLDTTQTRAHDSEDGIIPLPGEPIIRNDGTLRQLCDRVDALMLHHCQRHQPCT